jgi:hypothetical protein
MSITTEKRFAELDSILAKALESVTRRSKKVTPTDPAKPTTDRARLVERARKALDRWLAAGEYFAETEWAMEHYEVGPDGWVPEQGDWERVFDEKWKAEVAAISAIKRATPRRAGLKFATPAAIVEGPRTLNDHAMRHGRYLYIVSRSIDGERTITALPLDLCWLD